jgi:exopolysaccharide production negative regulator
MLMCNRLVLAALAALVTLGPVAVGADNPPPYASATEAYRQGVAALKAGRPAVALPALEYAAKRGVLGAQIKLARAYSTGRDVPKDDAKAFIYFEQIADQQADISPSSPIAKYAAEAFVALGQYYLDGVPAMPLRANAVYAVDLFRHAASYFGNAEAQYRLARLYIDGTGVEKNVGLAINWLAIAAKKQHAASQAMLGEILWRGQQVRPRQARGLALIILAHENAVASGKEPSWIGDLYREALGASNAATRKDAQAMLPQLGGIKAAASVPAVKAKPAEILVMPAGGAPDAVAPAATASSAAAPLGSAAPPPAAIGLSVGFGATSTETSPKSPTR